MPPDPASSNTATSIVRALAGEQASEDRLSPAEDLARAQLELIRIRSIRMEQLAKADLNECTFGELRRLAALDRYERYALTKRRRASQKLRSKEWNGGGYILPKRTQFFEFPNAISLTEVERVWC